MVNIKTLLPDLKELVKELDEDLLARATGNAEIDAGLREAFHQIEKGGRTAQAYRGLAGGLSGSGGGGVGARLRLCPLHGGQPSDRRVLAGG